MVRAEAYRILKRSQKRHATLATGSVDEPDRVFTTPVFLRIYKAECERKRAFIREGDLTRRRLEDIAETVRPLMADKQFRDLLHAEGLATLPKTLAARILHDQWAAARFDSDQMIPNAFGGEELIGGILPQVIDLFQDCALPPKIFGLLRRLAPTRQIEVAWLMIAMNRVTYNYAKALVALTPQLQFANPSNPGRKFAGLTDPQLVALKTEFADLSYQFRSAMEHFGTLTLEHISARGYLNRLMDNARVVRYLAQKFPEILSEFQKMTEPDRQAG